MGFKFVSVLPFSWGKRETLRKMPGRSRDSPGIILGQSREKFVYVFLIYWFFLALLNKTLEAPKN